MRVLLVVFLLASSACAAKYTKLSHEVTYADTPNKENDLMIARVDDAAA